MNKFVIFALLVLGAGRLPAADLMAMPEAQFAALPALAARIDSQALDKDLLAAAIFHATNRVRVGLKLPAFAPLPKLNDAADLQANIGGILVPPAHTNPFHAFATPLDRFQFVGLHPDRLAENIALLPAYDIDLTQNVGVRREGAETTFINAATVAVLEYTTYAKFADMIVQAWMGSPGHRANMVDPSFQYLGCSVRPARSAFGAAMIFGVQEFYTPRKKKSQPIPKNPVPTLDPNILGSSTHRLGGE